MSCQRCGGLCRIEEIRARRGEPCLRLWACLLCGDRMDETIRWYRHQAAEAKITQRWKELVWADVCELVRRKATA